MTLRLQHTFSRAGRALAALTGAFGRDGRGIAAVEFAMLAPVLVIAFIGTFEVSEAITVDRKVTHATSTIGDLITQSDTLTNSEVENIFDATAAVMSPYPTDTLKLVIATVRADSSGNPRVIASKARNTAAWPVGSPPPVTIPDGIDFTSQQVVIAWSQYAYSAVFGSLAKEIIGKENFTLGDVFFLRPRNSESITFE